MVIKMDDIIIITMVIISRSLGGGVEGGGVGETATSFFNIKKSLFVLVHQGKKAEIYCSRKFPPCL